MDHRWYERKSIPINVLLNRRDFPGIYCQCRNISLGGMFVEVDNPSYASGSVVEVIFAIATTDALDEYRIKASVIHVTPHGYGLMFLSINRESLKMLEQLLHPASQANGNNSQLNA
ncbi:MAG: PilZ domain-containing protein [Gammaproteobacteria bacterium]